MNINLIAQAEMMRMLNTKAASVPRIEFATGMRRVTINKYLKLWRSNEIRTKSLVYIAFWKKHGNTWTSYYAWKIKKSQEDMPKPVTTHEKRLQQYRESKHRCRVRAIAANDSERKAA